MLAGRSAAPVVIWRLTDGGGAREHAALRLTGGAFMGLAAYVVAQAAYSPTVGDQPGPSALGIAWTAATVLAILALANGKRRTGAALANRVLLTESRVTRIDAGSRQRCSAALALSAAAGWWWADPLSGRVIAACRTREGRAALVEARGSSS